MRPARGRRATRRRRDHPLTPDMPTGRSSSSMTTTDRAQLVAFALRRAGFEVVEAASGEAGPPDRSDQTSRRSSSSTWRCPACPAPTSSGPSARRPETATLPILLDDRVGRRGQRASTASPPAPTTSCQAGPARRAGRPGQRAPPHAGRLVDT